MESPRFNLKMFRVWCHNSFLNLKHESCVDGAFGEVRGEKLCVLAWAAHGQWQGNSFPGLIQGKGAYRWKDLL